MQGEHYQSPRLKSTLNDRDTKSTQQLNEITKEMSARAKRYERNQRLKMIELEEEKDMEEEKARIESDLNKKKRLLELSRSRSNDRRGQMPQQAGATQISIKN